MSNNSHNIQREIKIYKMVFCSLIVFTLLTVGASCLHIESVAATVAIALIISTIEAFLVAGFMMHLLTERKIIYGIMLFTVVFCTALIFLIIWTNQPGSHLHT